MFRCSADFVSYTEDDIHPIMTYGDFEDDEVSAPNAQHGSDALMAKQRGNPNWGKAAPFNLETTVSSFDSLVKSLGLTPDQYESSSALKSWVGKNKDHKYVPPDLLEAWGFKPSSEI